jgi:hypothetical protein
MWIWDHNIKTDLKEIEIEVARNKVKEAEAEF